MNFQGRVLNWLMACFSQEVCRDITERNHRFLEESLELVQSTGCTRSEAHQLVDYVFDRPVGETPQEIGGVKVTLSALCSAVDQDEEQCGEVELARIMQPHAMEKIRAKQAAKPKHSPLPEVPRNNPHAHGCTPVEHQGWQPIETAPRDGTIIELTWMESGQPQEIYTMQWGHVQRNGVFAPGVVGMWVCPGGNFTWTEHDPDGAPTHWRPKP